MSCNACGRPEQQHAWFDRAELETMWTQGIVLTICDGGDPDGAICLVTEDSAATPDNPHTAESLMEISS